MSKVAASSPPAVRQLGSGRHQPGTRLARLRTSCAAVLLSLVALMAVSACLAQDLTQASAVVTLGREIVIEGDGASAVGSHVTIAQAGTYVVRGELDDGMIEVRAPGSDVTLVLDGVHIVNGSGPAILFSQAASATVYLADGSDNYLQDGGASEFDAALYSATSLVIDGSGSLEVHAVYEGISSTMHIDFLGGTVRIWAGEDGVNANNDGVSQINVSGGYLFVATEEGDGIDSNGTITISGGTVITHGALVDANSGLDADGSVTISGGLVISAGGSMMGGITSQGGQSVISVDFASTQSAGTLVVILDAQGEQVLAFAPAIDFQQLILSSPDVVQGASYTVYAGGVAGGAATDGLYSETAAETGTLVTTVTAGSNTGGFGPGAPGGAAPGGRPGRP